MAYLGFFDGFDEINGKPYTLLMHVDGSGTVLRDGVFGDDCVFLEKDVMYVLVDDMFDEAVDTFPELSGSNFTFEVLIDGLPAVSAAGSFE